MLINLTPMRRDDSLELVREGTTLIMNGERFDFSAVVEGDGLTQEAVRCDWLASDVEMVGGVLQMTLILPHGGDASAAALFPEPVRVSEDGPVTLPV